MQRTGEGKATGEEGEGREYARMCMSDCLRPTATYFQSIIVFVAGIREFVTALLGR
jgi:hypothetical protein